MNISQIRRVAVIGLGTMGHGVAQAFAAGGRTVGCYDPVSRSRQTLKDRVAANLRSMSEAGMVGSDAIDQLLARLQVHDDEAAALADADFVIECALEELPVKQPLFERIESAVSPQTILATNTSSLPIRQVFARVKHRERALAAHWFNPPHLVPVVEVVPMEGTSPETVKTTSDLMRAIGKTPVTLTREVPGFVVNRVQAALYREVWSLLSSGIASAEDIDAAIRGSMGLRLASFGPLRINDFGGLDIWKHVVENLAPQIDSSTTVAPLIREKVAAGKLGVKTGEGIYAYTPEGAKSTTQERDRRLMELVKVMFPR